jgi:hypothetical protein
MSIFLCTLILLQQPLNQAKQQNQGKNKRPFLARYSCFVYFNRRKLQLVSLYGANEEDLGAATDDTDNVSSEASLIETPFNKPNLSEAPNDRSEKQEAESRNKVMSPLLTSLDSDLDIEKCLLAYKKK